MTGVRSKFETHGITLDRHRPQREIEVLRHFSDQRLMRSGPKYQH